MLSDSSEIHNDLHSMTQLIEQSPNLLVMYRFYKVFNVPHFVYPSNKNSCQYAGDTIGLAVWWRVAVAIGEIPILLLQILIALPLDIAIYYIKYIFGDWTQMSALLK